jgi:hypothetical protein
VEIAPVGVLESDTFLNKEENAEQALIGLYDLMQYNYAKDWSSAYFLKVLPGDELMQEEVVLPINHNYRILMITQMYLYQTQVY